jgi:hypothetical protein
MNQEFSRESLEALVVWGRMWGKKVWKHKKLEAEREKCLRFSEAEAGRLLSV